jgi:hypothetical protein
LFHLGLTAELVGHREDTTLTLTYFTTLTEFIKQ